MRDDLRRSFLLLAASTLLLGFAYPLAVTGIAQVLFPVQANGSLLPRDDRTVGSRLIGQPFADPRYFWSRQSATAPTPYNAAASTGSNLATSNPALLEAARARLEALHAADPGNPAPVPVDLVTASGSGLDPHISVAAALYQVPRVARARGLAEEQVRRLVAENTQRRQWGVFGEPRVHVLLLNLAIDANR